MAEKESRGGGTGKSVPDDRDDEYELDMDKHSSGDLDAAFQDAVAAVERESSGELTALEDDDEAEAGGTSIADHLKERLLRTLADFDNYRKRAEREKSTLRRMGTFDVLKDSLGVVDNLERALEAGGSVEDLKHGLRLVLKQFEEFLRRHGAERIAAAGQVFDPMIHEAVARQESDEVREPTVIGELQKGYLFHDRLLRPAMVHVAMPAAPAAAAPAPEAADESADGAVREPQNGEREVGEAVD
jgi:molecular chaperone GrpE